MEVNNIKAMIFRLSMVTQRIVNTERQLRLQAEAAAAAKREEVERLKGELTVLQVYPYAMDHATCMSVITEL